MNTTRSEPDASPRPATLILPPRSTVSLVVTLLYAKLALSVIGFLALFTLQNLANSGERLPVWEMERLLQSGKFNLWSNLLTFVAMIGIPVSAGLLLEMIRWLNMVYRNLDALGAGRRFDSRWAILGFLVPGLNLVRPYQIGQEVWMKSSEPTRPGRSLLLLFAWAAWLTSGVFWITLAALSSTMPIGEIQGLILTNQVLVALACWLTLIFIEGIQQKQRVRWLDLSTEPPIGPSQKLGPHHGIQVAVLGVAGAFLVAWTAALFGWGRSLAPIVGAQAALLLASVVIFQRPDWRWPGHQPNWLQRWTLVGSVMIGAALSLTWASLIVHQFPGLLEASKWTRRLKGAEELGFLVLVVLVAPVVEEVVFRGAILQSFRREWNRGPAILLSSLIFACLHIHPVTMMLAFMVGCLCATVRLATHSLVPAILLHATYNLGITLWLKGDEPGEWITADLAWRGTLWVALGLLLASNSRKPTAGSSTARGIALAAAAAALAMAALRTWNGGAPDWNLITALDGACWLALAVGVARQSRGAAVLLVLFHLATGSVSVIDIGATLLFVTAASVLIVIRAPQAVATLQVADPRWWWGTWAAPLSTEQIPRLTANTLDRSVDSYLGQAQTSARAAGERVVKTARRDLETGALASRLLKVLFGLQLATLAWGLLVSFRLLQQRSLYMPNREMARLAQHLEHVDLVASCGLLLLFVAFLGWLGGTQQKFVAAGLLAPETSPVWRWRGLAFPRRFLTSPRLLLSEISTASQLSGGERGATDQSSNLRAMLGLCVGLLLISLPAQLLATGSGLDGPARLLTKLRLSPLGMGLGLLLLVRLALFVRAVDRGTPKPAVTTD